MPNRTSSTHLGKNKSTYRNWILSVMTCERIKRNGYLIISFSVVHYIYHYHVFLLREIVLRLGLASTDYTYVHWDRVKEEAIINVSGPAGAGSNINEMKAASYTAYTSYVQLATNVTSFSYVRSGWSIHDSRLARPDFSSKIDKQSSSHVKLPVFPIGWSISPITHPRSRKNQ